MRLKRFSRFMMYKMAELEALVDIAESKEDWQPS